MADPAAPLIVSTDLVEALGLVAILGLALSLPRLRTDGGDRALATVLLSAAILGVALWVTVSSLHSWRWIAGLAGALAIPLVARGVSCFVDNVGDRDRFEGEAWRERPRY
jgi:hypothetical protein